jgi:hypothetical protein|tara:strand:+ start:339 stop:533 length:195 start_codon:yes stop_codon:yes gene_type:complete
MKTENLVKQAKELLASADAGKVIITRGVDGVTIKVEAHHGNATIKQLDGSHSAGVNQDGECRFK